LNCYFGRGDSPNRPRAVEVNRPYLSENGHERKESERFKSFTYEELTKRDKRVSDPNYFYVAGKSRVRRRYAWLPQTHFTKSIVYRDRDDKDLTALSRQESAPPRSSATELNH